MIPKTWRFAALLPLLLVSVALPDLGVASEPGDIRRPVADNAEQRINLSGKLRMLSQRIASAACHLDRGIDTAGARALLDSAPAEFEKILTALEFGDPDLEIFGPERRRISLSRIHELRAVWAPMQVAADAVANGTATQADLDHVMTQNMAVLGAAIRLVSELVKQYSNPNAITYADLLLIDISGRQRMLTQKMSKESCLLGTGAAPTTVAADLTGTIRVFDASLEALRTGLAEVGVKPPPNSSIAEGLEIVRADWQALRPQLDGLAEGGTLSVEADAQKFRMLNIIMANMNKVVGLYAEAAKPHGLRNRELAQNDL